MDGTFTVCSQSNRSPLRFSAMSSALLLFFDYSALTLSETTIKLDFIFRLRSPYRRVLTFSKEILQNCF